MPYIDQITRGETTYDIQDSATKAVAEAIPPMIAYEELTTTATHAYTAGNSYFILGGALYKATDDIAIGDPIVTNGADANCEAIPGGLGGEVSGLKSAINDLTDCAQHDLVPYACNGSTTNILNVVQAGNNVTISGTSNATSAQSATKILLTDHIATWNAVSVPSSEQVYPIKLISGHKYKLKATVVSGTRDKGSGSGGLIFRVIDSSGNLISFTIDINSTTGEDVFVSAGENIQIRMQVARLMTCTTLVVRIEFEDITVATAINSLNDVHGFISRNNAANDAVTSALVWPVNLVDSSTKIPGKRIDTGGAIVDSDAQSLSQYFPIKPSTEYINRTSATTIAFYDFNKNWISQVSPGARGTFTTPANAVYFRMSNQSPSSWQINEGNTLLDSSYEPIKLSKSIIKDDDSPYYKGEFLIGKPDVHEWYESICLKDDVNVFNFSLGTDTAYTGTQYADIIDLYDGLVSDAESGYITKTSIGTGSGTDVNGNPYTLYEYAFVPRAYTQSSAANATKKHPKILLECAMHGFEKNSAFAVFALMYDVVHNWKKNSFLSTLRNFVEIRIVPVADPYGFDNNVRDNANNVNINRNFPQDGWEPGDGANYGGEEPLDQPEAAAIATWIQENSDMFLYVAVHTNGHYYATGYGEANGCKPYINLDEPYYNKLYNAFVRHIERQTAILPTEFNVLTPTYGQKIGSIMLSNRMGTSMQYVCNYTKLALAITLEGCNYFKAVDDVPLMVISSGTVKMCAEIFGNTIEEILYEYAEG